MPRYRFIGSFETVLHDLSHGVNAVLHRKGHGQPDGSTVVAQPGDEVTTDKPYPHALMAEVDPPKKAPAKKAAPAAPVEPAAAVASSPATDGALAPVVGETTTEGQE